MRKRIGVFCSAQQHYNFHLAVHFGMNGSDLIRTLIDLSHPLSKWTAGLGALHDCRVSCLHATTSLGLCEKRRSDAALQGAHYRLPGSGEALI